MRVKTYPEAVNFVSDSQKNWLSDTLSQRFLMTYTSLIFDLLACPSFSPQPTFFKDAFTTYLCMIFVCVNCAKITFTFPQPTFYSTIFTAYFCMSHVRKMIKWSPWAAYLNDIFTTYFVCVGCLACANMSK